MAYSLIYPWRKNPRILQLLFSELVTADDLVQGLNQCQSLMDQAMMPLHMVIHFTADAQLPENILDILLKHAVFLHKNCGYCVFIDPNEFIHFVAKVLGKSTNIIIEVALDEADAWEFFSQMGLC